MLLKKALLGALPILEIGERLAIDHHEQIEIGDIAGLAVDDPAAPCMGAIEDNLQDAAFLPLGRELALQGLFEPLEENG
jgi:hypothetical protein